MGLYQQLKVIKISEFFGKNFSKKTKKKRDSGSLLTKPISFSIGTTGRKLIRGLNFELKRKNGHAGKIVGGKDIKKKNIGSTRIRRKSDVQIILHAPFDQAKVNQLENILAEKSELNLVLSGGDIEGHFIIISGTTIDNIVTILNDIDMVEDVHIEKEMIVVSLK